MLTAGSIACIVLFNHLVNRFGKKNTTFGKNLLYSGEIFLLVAIL